MADMFRRIFGMGPGRQPSRPDFIQAEGDGVRLRVVEDNTASAIAAKHNFAAIYGAANMPPNFAMRGVIEVQKDGAWVPVSGSNNFVPDMTAQVAFLQGYRETGQVGMQPINPNGSMATQTGGVGGTAGPSGSADKAAAKETQQQQPAGPSQLTQDQAALLESLGPVMRGLPESTQTQLGKRVITDVLDKLLPQRGQGEGEIVDVPEQGRRQDQLGPTRKRAEQNAAGDAVQSGPAGPGQGAGSAGSGTARQASPQAVDPSRLIDIGPWRAGRAGQGQDSGGLGMFMMPDPTAGMRFF